MGKIVYLVNLNTTASTDELSDEILAADPENIDKVEWAAEKEFNLHLPLILSEPPALAGGLRTLRFEERR